MLHELLLALNGYTGGVFVEVNKGEIQIVPDLPFIHPTEVSLINRLCQLGSQYKQFQAFIAKYGHSPNQSRKQNEPCLHGLYLKAFCSGLDRVLDSYRQKLLSLEKEILADPHLPVSHLQYSLEEYQLLFPALSNLIQQLHLQKAHGCYILELLHKSAANGIPSVKQAFLQIMQVCHGLLYKQLAAWMLHGLLLDHYGEFFIHRQMKSLNTSQHSSVSEEDDLGLAGVTGKQLEEVMKLSEDFHSNVERFSLRPEMLPNYIPVRVANKIMFVGESVHMFSNEKQKPVFRHTGSILKNKEDDFAKELQKLSTVDEFNLMEFEKIIDAIRSCVAETLWKLVVEESDLVGHLRIIKDFYLLGRGELFLAFIDQVQTLLSTPPTATTQHDVNTAFHQAARSVLFENDALLQRFQLTVEGRGGQGKEDKTQGKRTEPSVESGWSVLGLGYTVQWPLHILVTNTCLEKYNQIFCFLLAVKRVQLELQQLWALQMQQKHQISSGKDAAVWHLRTHMAFLVDNLQYYLQVDVIESQFSILLDKIHTTRDFEAIRLAHDQFITALLSQSFLLMRHVNHCLQEILENCHKFCVLVKQYDSADERLQQHMETITKNFQLQSNLLFKILSSVRSHQASPHLAQLLLRIDFNKYFSQAGGQLGRNQPITPSQHR